MIHKLKSINSLICPRQYFFVRCKQKNNSEDPDQSILTPLNFFLDSFGIKPNDTSAALNVTQFGWLVRTRHYMIDQSK